MEFPEIERDYRSRQLFPVFRNRVLNANVVRVNRTEASELVPVFPSERVLIEMRGNWRHHKPMSGVDYQPVMGGD